VTYIGQQPASTFDSGIQDRFTGLTTNTVTLNHEISAEEDILVVWNNIVQDKNTYSVGGTGNKTVTLGGTLVSADVVTVYYLNKVMQSVNPTAGSVGTEQLNADAVNGTKIADNSISDEHLDTTAITGHSAKTSLVDADEFLISDSEASGALKKVDLSDLPFSWKLLKTGSVSSGDGYATLTSVFTSTYKIYKIFFYDWNTSVAAAPYLQWVTGTNTVQSATDTYTYAGSGYNHGGGGSNWGGADTQFQIAGETIKPDADEHFAWEGTLYNPAGTTLKKRLVFAGGGKKESDNKTFSAHGAGEWSGTNALTGLKIFPSGGTFDSLSWRIYGIAK
tara:strand:+ start:48 stop:1049 length:1002 start_codon:yes stop_codon:yes gene_type:complete